MTPSDIDNAAAVSTITVCVPMYKNSQTIERCLRSILDQDGVDFEILVVDDDSPDDCAAIAAKLLRPGDRLVRNEPRLGLNGNHNRCLELARGDLIQFVHGDDWLLPGALRTLAPCFEDPTVGMTFAPRRVINDKKVPLQRRLGPAHIFFPRLRRYNRGPSLVAQMMLQGAAGNWIGEPTVVMFRRQLALDVGGFREDIYQLVDLDLWFRLMLRCAVCFVPRKLSVRTHSIGTESVNNLRSGKNWLDHLRILTWLIVDPASPEVVRRAAKGWWGVTWTAVYLGVALSGPERKSRLQTLREARVTEFARAEQLRDDIYKRGGAALLA